MVNLCSIFCHQLSSDQMYLCRLGCRRQNVLLPRLKCIARTNVLMPRLKCIVCTNVLMRRLALNESLVQPPGQHCRRVMNQIALGLNSLLLIILSKPFADERSRDRFARFASLYISFCVFSLLAPQNNPETLRLTFETQRRFLDFLVFELYLFFSPFTFQCIMLCSYSDNNVFHDS